ncbi:MAG TPA: hypothetical protein PK858_12215, partial [Saprospiraceae bacterium]|nr:hypothetical protein [Saprospiraceae bacterium]
AADPEVIGLISTGAMDIGRIGKAVVNADTGAMESYQVIEMTGNVDDPEHIGAHTWGVGLHTYRDIISPDVMVPEVKHIYWSCFGMDPRLLTKFIYDLYFDYPNRAISAEQVLKFSQRGIPFVLSRQDTQSMKIMDFYQFPATVFLKSTQFVPKSQPTPGVDPQMDGYIFTTVLANYPNAGGNNYQCEVWVFDAAKLAKGPVCTLNSPQMDYAFTLHSAWTQQAVAPASSYKIDVRQDYDPLIAGLQPAGRRQPIQDLFNRYVYPHFEPALANGEPGSRNVTAPPTTSEPEPTSAPEQKKKGGAKFFDRIKRLFKGKKK